MDTTIQYAQEQDKQDPLAAYREQFVIPEPDLIYMDGNSLGRLPTNSVHLAEDVVKRQWGERLIRGYGDGWWTRPKEIGAKIAQLIGAQPDEVIVSDSTSTNLFKLAVAALRMQGTRRLIHTDDLNFPSDIYILQGIIDLLGNRHQLDIVPSPDGIFGPADAFQTRLDNNSALLTISLTVFKSGYTYDMESITAAAHEAGALVIWDLSHSVGSVPIDLNGANVDMAIGCTYKYLNGGPGSPAFLYVRRDLQEQLGNPITGWWGQKRPFDFGLDYNPESGLQRFQVGSIPMLSLSLIEPAVDMFIEIGMEAVRAKSIQQTEYLIALWESILAPSGYTLNSPREAAWRGSHISLGHQEGWRINQCMIQEMNIIPDFREPDNIRLGIAPLYTRYEDIYETVVRMKRIVSDQLYEKYSIVRSTIT
jgi:kynureninase